MICGLLKIELKVRGLPWALFLFILAGFFNCAKQKEALAIYDGGIVTINDFLNNYRNYLKATGIKDNMPSRKLILNNVIHEKIALAEFNKNEMDKSISFIENQNLIYEQLLLNDLFEKEVLREVQFSDKQLVKYFTDENTLYHIKQVFAETIETAMQYYNLVQSGTPFEELVDLNKITEANCDLGFVSLSDVHPQFRKTVQQLKPGEFSLPIKGKYGYTVLKVEEKRVKLLLTEYEFAKQKNVLKEKLAIEYQDSLRNDYVSKMAKALNIVWFEDNLPYLFDIIKKAESKDDLPVHYDVHGHFSEPICSIEGTNYNYYGLLPFILKSRQEHIKAVREIASMKDFVAGIIVREQLLAQARDMKLDNSQKFQQQYNKKITKLKIDNWTQNFTDTVKFSEADYSDYYDTNAAEFRIPLRRNVYEICLPDKEIANRCIQQFHEGEDFSKIASKYSQFHQKKSPDGYLGQLSSEELGKYGASVFTAPIGEIVGPFRFDGAYYLFLSTEEIPGQLLSIQQARPIIEKRYRQDLARKKMMDYFLIKEKKYHVQINYQILKSIQYQDVGSKGGTVVNG